MEKKQNLTSQDYFQWGMRLFNLSEPKEVNDGGKTNCK